MAKINKYGMKMEGLRAASGETTSWAGYTQVSYDMNDGQILTNDHAGTPDSSWTQYHSNSIITVLNASRHYTMQEIADVIHDKVNEYNVMNTSVR